MVKVDNSRLPTQLPREVLSKLDPGLVELYSQLPPALGSRISFLMREALPQGIHPSRVFKFAFLYATAEQLTQGRRSKNGWSRTRVSLRACSPKADPG
jgi:hypothetical protein